MTDIEILEAMRAMMKEQLQQELEPIKNDIAGLKAGQATMQDKIDTMQDGIDTLKSDMAHHNHYVEPLIKATSEGMSGIQERNQQLDRLDEKVDGHDHRIWALEESVKTLKQA